MLTILTNKLVSNLITLQTSCGENLDVTGFVSQLVVSLTQNRCNQIRNKLYELEELIPQSGSNDSVEKNACSFGCSLLKELAFKFLTYA